MAALAIEPIEISAHELAEHDVLGWLNGDEKAPRRYAEQVARYQALERLLNDTDPKAPARLSIDKKMDAIYDGLIAAVMGAPAKDIQVSVSVAKQLRRIERREEGRMTLSERWRVALANPARAMAWAPAEWYALRKAAPHVC